MVIYLFRSHIQSIADNPYFAYAGHAIISGILRIFKCFFVPFTPWVAIIASTFHLGPNKGSFGSF